MGIQVTLTISDELYRQAQQLAQSSRRDVIDILADAIALAEGPTATTSLPPETETAVQRERTAFLALHPELHKQYEGQYVAIYQERVIDADLDFATLFVRVNQQYPGEFVLMRRVEEKPERVYHFRSPRFVTET